MKSRPPCRGIQGHAWAVEQNLEGVPFGRMAAQLTTRARVSEARRLPEDANPAWLIEIESAIETCDVSPRLQQAHKAITTILETWVLRISVRIIERPNGPSAACHDGLKRDCTDGSRI
ncbi:hypothetical protein [Acidovorax delafieldii]|uniref:hypothetical protein n=1 Tax=Acidovorax delafieldii TaxID=47920 RepID=UPI0018E09604|nr:hypothetical protein [Acidovorax delafieldii]